MGPPGNPPAHPPPPPAAPGPLGQRGFPVTPAAGGPPSRWTWQRLAVIAAAVVVVGLVLAAIVLATRKPAPAPTPAGVATASPSASASASPTDTTTPSPTPTAAPPTPTATAAPTAAPTANTPTDQANLLFPSGGSAGSECGSNGTYTGCPVTAGLVAAAHRWRVNNPLTPQPLCRCASTYSAAFAQQDDTLLPPGYQGHPDRAAVQVSVTRSGGAGEVIVVLLVRQADGTWLAFDTYCDSISNRLTAASPTTC